MGGTNDNGNLENPGILTKEEFISMSSANKNTAAPAAPAAEIYTKTWAPLLEGDLKATMLFCHGIGEHINRYNDLFSTFAVNGIKVISFDQRVSLLLLRLVCSARCPKSIYARKGPNMKYINIANLFWL